MSTSSGKRAEAEVVHYMEEAGHDVLARNWSNQWCEIDIVSYRDNVVHFVEVKYRKNSHYGSGFDYISTQKIAQLKKAALHWVKENNWQGDYYIDAVSVDGATGKISYIENAINSSQL